MSKYKIRVKDKTVITAIENELNHLVQKESQQETLTQEQLRIVKSKLTQVVGSFSKHFNNNVQVIPLAEQKLYEEEEPLDEELRQQVINLQKRSKELAETVKKHREQIPKKIQQAVEKQQLPENFNVDHLRKILCDSQKNTVDDESNREEVQRDLEALSDVTVEAHEILQKSTKELLQFAEEIPKNLKQMRDADEALKVLDSNREIQRKRNRELMERKRLLDSFAFGHIPESDETSENPKKKAKIDPTTTDTTTKKK